MTNMSALNTSQCNDRVIRIGQTDTSSQLVKSHIKKQSIRSQNKLSTQLSESSFTPLEPLIGGFAILRAVQLLNFDIYYLGLGFRSSEAARLNRLGDLEEASRLQSSNSNFVQSNKNSFKDAGCVDGAGNSILMAPQTYYETFLDDLSRYNPLQKFIDRSRILNEMCRFFKICFSLLAIMIGIDKTISNIILCILTRVESKGINDQEANNTNMGLFVLILFNLSTIYILFCTVFNGHLLWNLFSQRLFLVSRRFQVKTMLTLTVFIYLEYIVSISFVNNLYEWDFTSNNIQSKSYSVLANLRIFLTEQDEENKYIDLLLTIMQFARGIIHISPYITINYAIICLTCHVNTIRNQSLLTHSLKKKQKLRLVVLNKNTQISEKENLKNSLTGKKRRVNFITDAKQDSSDILGDSTTRNSVINSNSNFEDSILMINSDNDATLNNISTNGGFSSANNIYPNNQISRVDLSIIARNNRLKQDDDSKSGINRMANGVTACTESSLGESDHQIQDQRLERRKLRQEETKKLYLDKIRDFSELESYITNLYIFTGRLNRFMSLQGLTVYFIVHNLIITVSLIVPEAVRGGSIMAYLIRGLVIVIGIVPFIFGQKLNSQLQQLSKQIDRIIIQQQFINRRRDNLVRIRELIHDIRANCGGMLNFNIESGLKYLVVAFASAFFIEQERKYTLSLAIETKGIEVIIKLFFHFFAQKNPFSKHG